MTKLETLYEEVLNENKDRLYYVDKIMNNSPSYKQIDNGTFKNYGRYVGGFVDDWKWNTKILNTTSLEELIEIYNNLR